MEQRFPLGPAKSEENRGANPAVLRDIGYEMPGDCTNAEEKGYSLEDKELDIAFKLQRGNVDSSMTTPRLTSRQQNANERKAIEDHDKISRNQILDEGR